MYKEHSVFMEPNDNDILWRYLDFTKFIDLLESQSIFFTRADKFEDKFEGSYSKLNRRIGREVYKDMTDDQYDNMVRQISFLNKNMLRYTFISCWHMNKYESAAMWKLYSKSNEAVAIQTTYKRLKDCLNNYEKDIFIGKVNYIDYETEWLPEGNILYPYVHKRKSFIHENEVRGVIQELPCTEQGITFEKDICDYGISVPVDINILIENIYVSPLAPQWFVDLVNKVVRRYGYNKDVIFSKLNEEPIY
ncbi:hypothetical protein ACSXA3_08100 [Clostridium perfringens]